MSLTAAEKARTAWLDRIGIDRTCRLVGMSHGCITLTAAPDGAHTLWFYDWPMCVGSAADMRAQYAPYAGWLAHLYR